MKQIYYGIFPPPRLGYERETKPQVRDGMTVTVYHINYETARNKKRAMRWVRRFGPGTVLQRRVNVYKQNVLTRRITEFEWSGTRLVRVLDRKGRYVDED
jgi:hypothetical protein